MRAQNCALAKLILFWVDPKFNIFNFPVSINLNSRQSVESILDIVNLLKIEGAGNYPDGHSSTPASAHELIDILKRSSVN